MNIDQDQLRKIVTEILLSLEKAGYLKEPSSEIILSKKQAYVLCEVERENEFLEFLRNNKLSNQIQVTAILEEPKDELIDTLVKEELCETISRVNATPDPGIRLTVYPSIKRDALCEAGLGMDSKFTSMWLRGDFEQGRRSVILIGGIEPFTGLEPEFYQELILSYVKNLMKMNVKFLKDTKELLKVFDEIEKKEA